MAHERVGEQGAVGLAGVPRPLEVPHGVTGVTQRWVVGALNDQQLGLGLLEGDPALLLLSVALDNPLGGDDILVRLNLIVLIIKINDNK